MRRSSARTHVHCLQHVAIGSNRQDEQLLSVFGPLPNVLVRLQRKRQMNRGSGCDEIVDDIERSDLIIYIEQVPRLRNGMVGALLHDGP